jgi:uncharacterized protein YdhG (YjbR/CyaY superfamily)
VSTRQTFATIDGYIDAADPIVRETLQALRATVAAAVPDATECISYQMPAFKQKKVFLYFAAFKKHIGVYPPVHDPAMARDLAPYAGPKGNLQFPLKEPMPYSLIARVAQSLAQQYAKSDL